MSFIALAPVYRLMGASPWALQVSTAVLHLVAFGASLWIAGRRGGSRGVLLAGAVLLVLLRFSGGHVLTTPWNPYLPTVAWFLFLLAVWSVLEDDVDLLPVVVLAGSLCAQTHVSYVGLVGGLGIVALAVALVRLVRERNSRRWTWLGLSVVAAVLVWTPPVLEELRPGDGNLSLLVGFFAEASEPAVGASTGLRLVLHGFDPWRLLVGHQPATAMIDPSLVPPAGVLHLVAWLGAVAVAGRLRSRSLLRLHAVVAVALATGVLAASRITGPLWGWLTWWMWGVSALSLLAIGWTVGRLVTDRLPRAGTAVLGAVAMASSAALAVDAAHTRTDDVPSSEALRDLVPGTLGAMRGAGAGDGPYLVRWRDPVGVIGDLQSFGLVNELDRAGIDVGLDTGARLRAAPHLTIDPASAVGVLRLVTGPAIAMVQQESGLTPVAFHDPRSAADREKQERLRREVEDELRASGLEELAAQVDQSLLAILLQGPKSASDKVARMAAIGFPSAVFLEPAPSATGGSGTDGR